MVKWYYDDVEEVFKRSDNRGNHLAINIVEAQQIIRFVDLGYNNVEITNKVPISNPKCGSTTVSSFIKNYKLGNINMPEDAPVPTKVFDSITEENRLDDMESRIAKLESDVEEFKRRFIAPEKNNGLTDKVKSWIIR